MTNSETAALKELLLSMMRDRDEAVRTAVASLDRRLSEMNEFRAALQDQTRSYITREEHTVLERSIKRIEEAQANMQGRYAVGALMFSLIVIMVSWLLQWGFHR